MNNLRDRQSGAWSARRVELIRPADCLRSSTPHDEHPQHCAPSLRPFLADNKPQDVCATPAERTGAAVRELTADMVHRDSARRVYTVAWGMLVGIFHYL
jgi:hypothetical protein